MSLLYKTLDYKAKTDSKGLGEREFDGYASTFLGPVDSHGDIIAPGAFKANLDWFLENGVLLREHNMRSAVGKPVECREDEHGLYLKGYISATTDGNDALTLLRDRVIKKMSIGFMIEGYEMLSEARGVEVLGSQEAYDQAIKGLPWWSDGLRLLTGIKLYETSLVAFPSNTAADISGVKSLLQGIAGKVSTEREYERLLRDVGFTATQAKTLVSSGYKALQRDAEAETKTADDSAALVASLKALTDDLRKK